MKSVQYYITLLKNYCTHSATWKEKEELWQWLRTEDGEKGLDAYLDTQWTDAEEAVDVRLSSETSARILKRVKLRTSKRSPLAIRRPVFWKYVAAVCLLLLLPVTGWVLGMHRNEDESTIRMEVPQGHKAMVVLADGSKVWINSGSSLCYSRHNAREVQLEGEAYFEVAKDQQHQFVVHTAYGTIKVYGTAFNVQAHAADSLFSVALIRGSIGLTLDHCNKEWRLRPNERVNYDARNHQLKLVDCNLEDAGSWRQHELRLENAGIDQLWNKMEGWYSMRFIIQNRPVKRHLYNVTIQTESVEETLELINKITPIEYVIKGKEVTVCYK